MICASQSSGTLSLTKRTESALWRRVARAKDAAIASGLTRADLAARLNAVAGEYQGLFAERLGAAAYQRLMGVPAGERVDIIEPELEAVAGVDRS
jgi:hypothetical protein